MIQDFSLQAVQQKNSPVSLFLKEVTLWSPPWKWVGNQAIPFRYTLDGIQKTALKIHGNGSWNRREKKMTLEPMLEWPQGSEILFPLNSHCLLDFQNPVKTAWQWELRTSSGIQGAINGHKIQNGYRITPSWIRFQDSLLEYNGDYISLPHSQLYLETTGNLDLSQLEKLLSVQTRIFSKIDPKLNHIEAGVLFENQQFVVEDLVADYHGGTLSIRGVVNVALPYRFRFSLRGDKMELAQAFQLKQKQSIDGTINWALTLQGQGAHLDTLEGQGKFEIWEGELWKLNLFSGLAKVLQTPQLEHVVFDQASGQFLITEKKVVFPHVQLRSPELILDGKGSVSLENREIDFLVTATFSSNFLSQIQGTPTGLLTTLLTTPDGKAIVQIRISGTFDSPQYKPQPVSPGQFLQRLFQGIVPKP
jgi:hypothetical protein